MKNIILKSIFYIVLHSGGCTSRCLHNEKRERRTDLDCTPKAFASRYRYYLAFESSFCKDYVSEKIIKGYRVGSIPIVMGAANYSDILPPHSYIDIRG